MKKLFAVAVLAVAVAALPTAPALAKTTNKRLAPGQTTWIAPNPINVQVRVHGQLADHTYYPPRRLTCYSAIGTYGESCTAMYFQRSGKLKNYSRVPIRVAVIR
jgi:hypothetical protein